MARVSDTARQADPVDSTTADLREYVMIKGEITTLTKRQKELRDTLITTIEHAGYTDDQGHGWIEFDDEVAGTIAIQRQRKVKRGYDEEAAEKILTDLGLDETCFKTVRVIDEDAVYSALYEERLTEANIDEIFPQKIEWALVLK